jgi:alpha-L-fucosidase
MAMPEYDAVGDWRWWAHDRLGMFIHWGLYALPARHEWVKNIERITDADYQRYFDHFDPDLYDPQEWAAAARRAGFKYVVLTTKHHEGFCLWDSRYTDYKVTRTPYGRDLLHPFVDAFRAEGLRVGFYHSLIDWHHPEFPVDRVHPMRDDAASRAEPAKRRDDGHSRELRQMGRELQPGSLVNDRLDLLDVPGGWDYRTPEQVMIRDGVSVNGKPVLWETCQTFSGSWGYHRDEATWKSTTQLVQMLIDTVSKGGNLLLNVGPTARGEFDARATDRLDGMGEWMRRHGRSVYGCTRAPAGFTAPQDCRLTYNPETHRLYLHLFNWPIGTLDLPGMAGKVAYAQLLHDGSEVRMTAAAHHTAEWGGAGDSPLTLMLPVVRPDVAVPVVELFLK